MKVEKIEKLIEKMEITEEEVKRTLETAKAAQCIGGLAAFKGERKGAIIAAFSLMENHPKLDFSEAMSISWYFIKGQRSDECAIAEEIEKEFVEKAKAAAGVNSPAILNRR